MLMRILGDNPGHSFTRHFDAKFCSAIKDVLRSGRDLHVRHYLCEYLAYLEATRYQDDDLQLLLQVWAKKKAKAPRAFVSSSHSGFVPNAGGKTRAIRVERRLTYDE